MSDKKEASKGILVLASSLIFLLAFIFIIQSPANKPVPKDLVAVLRPLAKPLKPFTLFDKDEIAFTNNKLKDKWSFIFFGYTHCPDICPTTLTTLKQVNKVLGKALQAKSDFQVIFVSVDPARDTAKGLGEYTAFFNKDFIGVTGQSENILAFAKQFSAAYIKEAPTAPGEYLISHASSIFLVNPKMEYVAAFSPPHSVETIAAQYMKIRSLK